MSDTEESLKRSARLRLIGAVALALITVVALPMILDKEPPPLAEVDIVIPSRDVPGKSILLEGGAGAAPGATDTTTPPLPATATSPTLNAPAPVTPTAVTSPASVAPVLNAPTRKSSAATAGKDGAKIDLPKAHPPATSGYFLQLGAFSSAESAKKLAKQVADAGFTVHVVEDEGRYKVRCGPVSAKPAVQDLQTRLRGKGFVPVVVNP